MFNKKMLAASMAIAMTTGGMVAQNASAIEVASNNIGQVLLGGGYFVENGYSTDLVVVNTRTDAAVQAKVVFRSHKKSREVLDFFIYLTPGDTFRANLTLNADTGQAHINSTDDSVRNAADTDWGNNDALDADFFTDKIDDKVNDSNTFGHFEVISYLTAGTSHKLNALGDREGEYLKASTNLTDDIVVKRLMSKDDLKALFDTETDNAVNIVSTVNDGTECTPEDLVAAQKISKTAPCSTELTAEVIIKNDSNRASYQPVALAADDVMDMTTYVIANTALDMVIASQTDIGDKWGDGAAENILAIETALSASATMFPWESNGTDQGTDMLVSFVTKYRHEDDTVGLCGSGPATASKHYSAPFFDTTDGEVEYIFYNYNNSEERTVTQVIGNSLSGGLTDTPDPDKFYDEVNYQQPSFMKDQDSGWAHYSWTSDRADLCTYKAVPVVAHTYKYEVSSDFRHMLERTTDRNDNN